MILTDILVTIRENLTDTVEEYRFSTVEITTAIDAACIQLIQDRPDAQLADSGAINVITGSAQITLINDRHREAIIHFACHKLFLKDSEDTHNATLSVTHKQAYDAAIN